MEPTLHIVLQMATHEGTGPCERDVIMPGTWLVDLRGWSLSGTGGPHQRRPLRDRTHTIVSDALAT